MERERLLYGNWKIKQAAGLYFQADAGTQYAAVCSCRCHVLRKSVGPRGITETEKGDPAYTAGVLMGKRADGSFVIIDVINKRLFASDVRALIKLTAEVDNAKYGNVRVRLPQDPGQAGKDQAQSFVRLLSGFSVRTEPVSGSKESRAEPVAAQWQAGNFDVVVGDWNEKVTFPRWRASVQ